MAISVHGLRERRRRLSDTVHHHFNRRRKTVLFAGDDLRTILQPIILEDLGPCAGI